MGPSISVVMPVYNVEPYLEQAIDSVLKQTFSDFELICVNDGSTDGSGTILDSLKKRDPRIKVITQENQKLSGARNNGMEAATGKYLIFLDSDDIFESTMFDHLFRQAEKTNADVVICGFRVFTTEGKLSNTGSGLRNDLLVGKKVFSSYDYPSYIFNLTSPNTWNKLIRREFWNGTGLRFQMIQNTEDLHPMFSVLALAEKISWINEFPVLYRVDRKGSLETGRSQYASVFLDAEEALYQELNCRGVYERLKKAYANQFISTMIYCLGKVEDSPKALASIWHKAVGSFLKDKDILDLPDDFYHYPREAERFRQYRDRVLTLLEGGNDDYLTEARLETLCVQFRAEWLQNRLNEIYSSRSWHFMTKVNSFPKKIQKYLRDKSI